MLSPSGLIALGVKAERGGVYAYVDGDDFGLNLSADGVVRLGRRTQRFSGGQRYPEQRWQVFELLRELADRSGELHGSSEVAAQD